MHLNVLLVEDQPQDLKSYLRDLPGAFEGANVQVTLHPADSFEQAYELIEQSHIRFDLILSDTFRGNVENRDAAVIEMVNKYRGGRFCPMIVFSASARPELLQIGAFVMWADKAVPGGIEAAIKTMLSTGVPQLARSLHDELDRTAGGFLWDFLESNWPALWPAGTPDVKVLERLVRRRAALQFAEFSYSTGTPEPVTAIEGLEYYTYPPLHKDGYGLGQIIRKKNDPSDIRSVLTPHCHLTVQQNQTEPRAKHVLTVKAIPAKDVLGEATIASAKTLDDVKKLKRLRVWSTPPSGDAVGKPEGRFWFLPAFLEIPHLYCDFQQLESLPYQTLVEAFDSIAVLTPPFAESLQACFLAYHAGVGISNMRPESIKSLLD